MQNRTQILRNWLALYLAKDAQSTPLYIAGPNADFGVDGEVSYTFMTAGMMSKAGEQDLCDLIMKNVPEVHRAHITKVARISNGRAGPMQAYRLIGGNLKVTFKTRADGRQAKASTVAEKHNRALQRWRRRGIPPTCPHCGA